MVVKSELNSANKLEAINTLEVPVVTYSFNIINWTLQELAKLDTKTRNFLNMYKMHHPKSDVDRLYLPRNEGGGGFIQLELSYESTTIGLDKYFQETQDTLLHFVKRPWRPEVLVLHQQTVNEIYSGIGSTTCRGWGEYHLSCRTKAKAKHQGRQQLMSKWESKALHGKYPQWVKQADMD